MSEVELVLVNDTDKCTIYTIQFSEESETEYERFYSKFIEDAQFSQDLLRIVQLVDKIADIGALERFSDPRAKCVTLLWLFPYFVRNSVYIAYGFLTQYLFLVMGASRIRERTKRMIR